MDKNLFGKLFPKKLQFWAKTPSVVGIDIGGSSIKIVQLRKEKERAILETYGELAAGPYAEKSIGQVAKLPEETVITMLKDLFKESGMNTKEAIVAIPVKSSFVTTIRVPLVRQKEMDDVVRFEARKYIPVPLDEVELDWWILTSQKKENEEEKETETLKQEAKMVKEEIVEVLLVAIHKDVIQKYRNIMTTAGLNIKMFEIEIFSAWRSAMFRPTAPVMVIDLGASSSKMSVVEAGVLRASHVVDRGAQTITDSIAKSLKISFKRAEEMKRQVGLSSQPEHRELLNVVDPILSFILAEARQFMTAYRRKYDNSIGQVVLTGGGALLKGVNDVIVKSLGVEVITANPFSKTEHPSFLEEALKEIGPSFSIAIGLALRGL